MVPHGSLRTPERWSPQSGLSWGGPCHALVMQAAPEITRFLGTASTGPPLLGSCSPEQMDFLRLLPIQWTHEQLGSSSLLLNLHPQCQVQVTQSWLYRPEEDLFHGGDGGPEAGDAQLLLLLLQLAKETFKPGEGTQSEEGLSEASWAVRLLGGPPPGWSASWAVCLLGGPPGEPSSCRCGEG